MKPFLRIIRLLSNRYSGHARLRAVLVALTMMAPWPGLAADAAKTFATPDEAAAALATAVRTHNVDSLRSILGPDSKDLENPDPVQATNEFQAFAAALDQNLHLVHDSDTRCELELGANSWPFPIPIVRQDGRWFFDTPAGKEELLNRRIGKNELEALAVMRAYVDAQREYASRDRDGDGVLEYAQKLSSSPGQTDGLYWAPELNGETSPLGPLVARAQEQGYFSEDPDDVPDPFHGYFFKILTRQGKHAPGGKYDYIINGNMIGGFALVGWPADYGASGVMTFLVNQQGRVFQKDLGPKTSRIASRFKAYDPDLSWTLSPD